VQFSIEMVPDPVATVYPELYRANWEALHGKEHTPPAAKPAVPLTDEQIDELSRTMVKGNKSVNWLCRAIEAAHGITKGQP
jgi:hypothetical protein